MTVSLSPGEIVSHVLDGGIEDSSSIKTWRIYQLLVRKVFGPVEDVAAGEQTDNVGHNLVSSSAIDSSVGTEHEGVFIALTIAEEDFIELSHNIDCTFVHQIQSCFLIGFGKLVIVRKFVKTFAINSDNNPSIWQ